MDSIKRATVNDTPLIVELGRISFIESHGHSAAPHEIEAYIKKTYTSIEFEKELSEPKHIYHIIYHESRPAGFSKIILNSPHEQMVEENITKLERLYLVKEFYGLNLGKKLFQFNVDISKKNDQCGMWLLVWKENKRALAFYEKSGFKKVGDDVYKLSETHSNPNYIMLLEY